ncbi:hypothetical protein [Dokdonella koreensis]|uniref:Uncharacterized protein n=1 Tax=Dokdonella koreensis DS-123 TaxID=1300342 RepID=A0A160DU87_9GAMM|nr:hypothetical protein [Dokdonella koreensis]ANB17233.1 Hypothetical protein I596_1203 [Dokdonella koreensis DS-123]
MHSKIACWTLLLDCLLECDALYEDAVAGRIGFAINYLMVGPINKTLDLVFTRVPRSRSDGVGRRTFAEVGLSYGIELSEAEQARLAGLEAVFEERKDDVSEVAIAVEAKACMTDHVGALPRLHAEILATGYLARRAAPQCTVISYTLVNTADSFVSGDGKSKVMRQPDSTKAVLAMLANAVPLRRDEHGLLGYDAVGALTIECRNDGSPVTLSGAESAPRATDSIRYERMIRQICATYRNRR